MLLASPSLAIAVPPRESRYARAPSASAAALDDPHLSLPAPEQPVLVNVASRLASNRLLMIPLLGVLLSYRGHFLEAEQ